MPKRKGEPEAVTRKKRIDTKLNALGWKLAANGAEPERSPYRKEEVETANGPADYGLYVDGKLIAVVEAKKVSLGPQNVLTQAERYAKGLHGGPYATNGYGVPFVYSTNGEVIWFRDLRDDLNRSRKVAAFHSPAGLRELVEHDSDAGADWLQAHPSEHPWLRYYQHDAASAIEQAIAERKRHMLLAMATGTGKTFTLVNEIYRLMKSGDGEARLVPRRPTGAGRAGGQGVRVFRTGAGPQVRQDLRGLQPAILQARTLAARGFRPERPSDLLFDGAGARGRPSSTSPRFSAWRSTSSARTRSSAMTTNRRRRTMQSSCDIPIHAFDVVIADECHRGYTSSELSVWRNTIDHFDAIKIGLTATPAAHSKAYFKDIVYRYDYEQAVRGRLPRRLRRPHLPVGRPCQWHLPQGGRGGRASLTPTTGQQEFDLLEDERAFDTTEIERKVTSPDSNRKILEELKRYTDRARGALRPLPKDPDLRGQRPAAHLPRRPASRYRPRCLRPRRRDSSRRSRAAWIGRCSGSASSATVPSRASPCRLI